MSMTDPIADMLTRIRNAMSVGHPTVAMPSSKLKAEIARILKEEGFIVDFEKVESDKGFPQIRIDLKWAGPDSRNAIDGLRRISRPGQRKYVGKEKIPKVRGGQGVAIITTSKGVMSDRNARKSGVGGEVMCEVW